MAATCPKCATTITAASTECPACGAIIAKVQATMSREAQLQRLKSKQVLEQQRTVFKSEVFKLLALFIAVAALAGAGYFMKINALPSQATELVRLEIVHNSPWDGSVRQVEKHLKQNLKDPDSLKVDSWGAVIKDGTGFSVSLRYRAKNSFGAYVLATQEFRLDSNGVVISVTDK